MWALRLGQVESPVWAPVLWAVELGLELGLSEPGDCALAIHHLPQMPIVASESFAESKIFGLGYRVPFPADLPVDT